MTLDISGRTFDPRDNHNELLLAQGKLSLDSEQNEAALARDRRWRVGTMDLVGRAGYPAWLPDSFRITIGPGGGLRIGVGRMYVDGFLAENHGLSAADGGTEGFDAPHAELRSSTPVPFDRQPYLPGGTAPDPASGDALVYLDVWRREVDHLKDPSLVEPAVGVDTAGRIQTVWQVKALGVPEGVTCATPDDEIDAWQAEIQPSTIRLTTLLVPVADPGNPCDIPPGQRLRTTENRTYRVATHGLHADGRPLLKWSRSNGSVATRVTTIGSATQITAAEVARDDVHRFAPGDWFEMTDDRLEFAGLPGLMRMVETADPATGLITFQGPVPAGTFPANADGLPDPDRNLRIIRWDQKGEVRASGGALLEDLANPLGPGVFPIPPAGEFVELEAGIAVEVSFAPGPQKVRVDDHWVFRARAATGRIEILDAAPPVDTHHHYARLAVVEGGAGGWAEPIDDCRNPIGTDDECCCTFVVAPGQPIQQAIDQLPPSGGCICLKPGTHAPQQTLVLGRSGVTLHGEAKGVVLQAPGGDPALRITGTVREPAARNRIATITFVGDDVPAGNGGLLDIAGAEDLVVSDCRFLAAPEPVGIAIRIAASDEVTVRDCRIDGAVTGIYVTESSGDIAVRDCGIETGRADGGPGLVGIGMDRAAGPIEVSGCAIRNGIAGIVVNDDPGGTPFSLAFRSRVTTCTVECAEAPEGIPPGVAIGIDMAAGMAEVRGNLVRYPGPGHIGIRLAAARSSASGNRCLHVGRAPRAATIGIVVGASDPNLDIPPQVEDVEVSGNVVEGPQSGILALNTQECRITGNHVGGGGAEAAAPGILAQDCTGLDVAGNDIGDCAVGIGIVQGGRCRIADNRIERGGFGIVVMNQDAPTVTGNRLRQPSRGGILVAAATARTVIGGNRVLNAGFAAPIGTGIGCYLVLGETAVTGNEVMDTGQGPDGQASNIAWGIFGDLVLEALVAGNLVTYSGGQTRDPAGEDRALRYRGLLETSVTLADRRIVLGFPIKILGNSFTGSGATALVEILSQQLTDTTNIRFERVTFSDNYCMHVSLPPSDNRATVSLSGRHAAVVGNQIKSLVGEYFPVNLNFMDATYVGNVAENVPVQGGFVPTPTNSFNLDT